MFDFLKGVFDVIRTNLKILQLLLLLIWCCDGSKRRCEVTLIVDMTRFININLLLVIMIAFVFLNNLCVRLHGLRFFQVRVKFVRCFSLKRMIVVLRRRGSGFYIIIVVFTLLVRADHAYIAKGIRYDDIFG